MHDEKSYNSIKHKLQWAMSALLAQHCFLQGFFFFLRYIYIEICELFKILNFFVVNKRDLSKYLTWRIKPRFAILCAKKSAKVDSVSCGPSKLTFYVF